MEYSKQEVVVHPRINRRHPDVTEEDVRTAWENILRIQKREKLFDEHYLAIGVDKSGRILEMVAVPTEDDTLLIFHAMRATKKTLRELSLIKRRDI